MVKGEGRPAAHRQWSLCVFDDLLEYASSSAVKYRDYFIMPMLNGICDNSAPVRQVGWEGQDWMTSVGLNCQKSCYIC